MQEMSFFISIHVILKKYYSSTSQSPPVTDDTIAQKLETC